MWGISIQPDLAAAIVDRTDALSLLGSGLDGLIWLTVGLLAWMAACDLLSQRPPLRVESAGPASGWRSVGTDNPGREVSVPRRWGRQGGKPLPAVTHIEGPGGVLR